MAYRDGETMRLEEVRDMGINPTAILDIGAHSGQFYGWAKRVWSNSFIWMVEANHLHERTLENLIRFSNDAYLIAALGDEEREVTFYTRSDKPHTEGNSYYKEHNYWDIPQLVQESKMTLQLLDNLFEDDSVFDIIKADTPFNKNFWPLTLNIGKIWRLFILMNRSCQKIEKHGVPGIHL